MKLQDFRKLIREMVEEEVVMEKKAKKQAGFIDKLGTFYVVMNEKNGGEKKSMNITDFLTAMTNGSMDMKSIAGIYKNPGDASTKASEMKKKFKENETEKAKHLKEVEAQKEALKATAMKALEAKRKKGY